MSLNVELLSFPSDAELKVAMAAKLCYSPSNISSLKNKIESNDQHDFINNIVDMGHLSVLEHVSFSFSIEGVSRVLTHQLVRHRVASYSQQSQRYVKADGGFEYITPDSVKADKESHVKFDSLMNDIAKLYDELLSLNVPAEDARYILPNAAETKIIVTMNARELLHFFSLRSCNRAQWEIRNLSDKMLGLAHSIAPIIFKSAGPSCVRGKCSEGKFNCGKAKEVKLHIASIKESN